MKVRFKHDFKNIFNGSSVIPQDYLIHGNFHIDEVIKEGVFVTKYNDYYICKVRGLIRPSTGGSHKPGYLQLGFLRKDIISIVDTDFLKNFN